MKSGFLIDLLAPQNGLEPVTYRLTEKSVV